VSVPMISSDLERRDARDQIIPADLRKYSDIFRSLMTKFNTVIHVGRGRFLESQPLGRGGTPASSKCFGTSNIRPHDMTNSSQILCDD